jgi:hypothetical protein
LLDALRQARVQDVAHVAAVDAHAERDRGDDDLDLFLQEAVLVLCARLRIEAGVVRRAAHAVRCELRGELIDVLAPQAIHDAGLVRMAPDHRERLRRQVAARMEAVRQVRAVAASDDEHRIAQPELLDDVRAHGRRGGRGVRLDRELGVLAPHEPDLAVLGPEVVAPVADAVRFVDDERREPRREELGEETLHHQALRRDEDELQLPVAQRLAHLAALVAVLRARQHRRVDAARDQAVDLVLHERDQRTHDGRQTRSQERGRLVAQALAGSRREHDERVAALERGEHRLRLERPQRRVPPGAPDDGRELGEARIGGVREERCDGGVRDGGRVRRGERGTSGDRGRTRRTEIEQGRGGHGRARAPAPTTDRHGANATDCIGRGLRCKRFFAAVAYDGDRFRPPVRIGAIPCSASLRSRSLRRFPPPRPRARATSSSASRRRSSPPVPRCSRRSASITSRRTARRASSSSPWTPTSAPP